MNVKSKTILTIGTPAPHRKIQGRIVVSPPIHFHPGRGQSNLVQPLRQGWTEWLEFACNVFHQDFAVKTTTLLLNTQSNHV